MVTLTESSSTDVQVTHSRFTAFGRRLLRLLPGWCWRTRGAWLRRITDAVALVVWGSVYWTLFLLFQSLGWTDEIVSSPAGYQTLLQVVPAAIVAVYGFVLATALVIAQVAARGPRTVRMLMLEPRLRGIVAGTVVIAVLGLWLAGRAPGSEPPNATPGAGAPAWQYTGAAALAVLSAVILLATAVVLGQTCHCYCSPYQFHRRLSRLAERGEWPLIEATKAWRQWLCSSARQGASRDLLYACRTALLLADTYIEAVERDPSFAGTPRYGADEREAGDAPRGRDRTGWYIGQLSKALVRAVEEGARAKITWRNLDEMFNTQLRLLRLMIQHGRAAEARRVVLGIAEISDLARQAEQGPTKTWFDRILAEGAVAASLLDAGPDRAGAQWEELLAHPPGAVGRRRIRPDDRLVLGVALLGSVSVGMVTAGARARGGLRRRQGTTSSRAAGNASASPTADQPWRAVGVRGRLETFPHGKRRSRSGAFEQRNRSNLRTALPVTTAGDGHG